MKWSLIYVFKALGLSPLIMHKKRASSMFNLVKSQDEDYNNDHNDVKKIPNKIQEEMKKIEIDKS